MVQTDRQTSLSPLDDRSRVFPYRTRAGRSFALRFLACSTLKSGQDSTGVTAEAVQPAGAGASDPMSLTLRLLGPDVPQDFNLSVDSSLTVSQVKEKARSEWPDGLIAPPLMPASIATTE